MTGAAKITISDLPPTKLLNQDRALSIAAPRLNFIDGLRCLAMLMVLACHCWLFGGQWSLNLPLGNHSFDLASLLIYGSTGVNLFLVLSGFCLYWPFVKDGARREPTLWEFAKKRCRRILPPYYMALLIFGAPLFLSAFHHHSHTEIQFAWTWLCLHILMVHNLNPEYVIRVDGALWTLALEFQLYILFPLFVEAFRRFTARRVLLTVLFASLCYHFWIWQADYVPAEYSLDPEDSFVLNSSVFGRCFEFVLGMYCAVLVAEWSRGQKISLRRSDYLLFALLIPMCLLDNERGIFTDAMWGLIYAALLLVASRPRTFIHRILSHRRLVSLGIFSYSVYLIHQPLVIQFNRLASHHLSHNAMIAFQFCLLIPTMIGVGYLFHLLFERPFLNAPRTASAEPSFGLAPAPTVSAEQPGIL